jgi:hypothetical protein
MNTVERHGEPCPSAVLSECERRSEVTQARDAISVGGSMPTAKTVSDGLHGSLPFSIDARLTDLSARLIVHV